MRGGAGYPAAPPGSPSSPPRWARKRPPAHLPGSGRRGTCPGSSAPGPLRRCKHTAQATLHTGAVTDTCAGRDITQRLTMVENTLFQQCLPHAHSLYARVDTGALLHLPVDQFRAHTTLPVKMHKSIKVFLLVWPAMCFSLLPVLGCLKVARLLSTVLFPENNTVEPWSRKPKKKKKKPLSSQTITLI